MIGGEDDDRRSIWTRSLRRSRPASTRRRARPGRQERDGTAEQGYLHCGPHGAGHFVKMVHNGIEYGLMAAYAEGLNILRNANAGKRARDSGCRDDAAAQPRVLPVRAGPARDRRGLAPRQRDRLVAAGPDRRRAASTIPTSKDYAGRVSDSGEGRWTIAAAIDEGVPAPVLSAALYERFSSRGDADFADRVLSAMRKQFGGHDEKKKEDS